MRSQTKASATWRELKPFAIRDIANMLQASKSSAGSDTGYYITLYDKSAQKLLYYSMSVDGLAAALAAAESGDIVWLPAGTIAPSTSSYTPGEEISSGSVTATKASGTSISGLTIGEWYCVDGAGGPWAVTTNPYSGPHYDYELSNNGGSVWSGAIGLGGYASAQFVLSTLFWFTFTEAIDEHYGRVYFRATTTSISFRAADGFTASQDVTGSIGYILRHAVVGNGGITVPAGVELVGLGKNSIIDGSIVCNGKATNLSITGQASGDGNWLIYDSADRIVTNEQIQSQVADETPPFIINSSALVTNLNADMLDGHHYNEIVNGSQMNLAYATNAAAHLTTPTYDGSGQAVHPSVLYFPDGWNGHKYWMAMTPFPAGDSSKENPSILVSEDGTTWSVPTGLINPISGLPATAHYNDTELLISADGLTLYCYYGWEAGVISKIYVRSSTDGITWSAASEILSAASAAGILSPAVFYDGDQYVMYTVDASSDPHKFYRRTCATPDGAWSTPVLCTVSGVPDDNSLWHHSIYQRGGSYHGFFAMGEGEHPIYFGSSLDGIIFTLDSQKLLGAGGAGSWDDGFLYRATAVPTASGYDLWYSASDDATTWVHGYIGRTVVALRFPIHDPVTVSDTSTIGLTLSGQALSADLKNTTVMPGSYTHADFTVDAQGRITEASSGTTAPSTRWEPVTDGDPDSPEFVFSDGDIVMTEITN